MSTFAVSKVALDESGKVTQVLWGVVDAKSNQWVSPEVEASAADVIDALHRGDHVAALFPSADGHLPERQFAVQQAADGAEHLVLEGQPTPSRELSDMDSLTD